MVEFRSMIGEAGDKFNGNIIDIENPHDIHHDNVSWANYFTVLPISSKEYRESSNSLSKAGYHTYPLGARTGITIFDDYGTPYTIIIDNDDSALKKTLNYFKEENIPYRW